MSRLRRRLATAAKLTRGIAENGASTTAFGPLWGRWLMHKAGTRPDPACAALIEAFTGAPPALLASAYRPAVRIKQLAGRPLIGAAYPCPRPSTPATFINHRTDFFDTALEAATAALSQVVILGAGWDTRAYGRLKDRQLQVYEVDAPGTQQMKRAVLADAGIAVGDVRFVSAEFNTQPWFDTLLKCGFDPARPTFFLWEGVTYYLQADTVSSTLNTIATKCARGTQIAFDYASHEFVTGSGPTGTKTILRSLKLIGEPWTFGIPTSAPAQTHADQFITKHHLTMTDFELFGAEGLADPPFGGLILATN